MERGQTIVGFATEGSKSIPQYSRACVLCRRNKTKCDLFPGQSVKPPGMALTTPTVEYADILCAKKTEGSDLPGKGKRRELPVPKDIGELLVQLYTRVGEVAKENAALHSSLTLLHARVTSLTQLSASQKAQMESMEKVMKSIESKLDHRRQDKHALPTPRPPASPAPASAFPPPALPLPASPPPASPPPASPAPPRFLSLASSNPA
ncbi:hypothetical protein JR316_0012492 [Psilocybe cubensis]|nr:hypothetical protein JR316_0012492 [Psilocybe cubensis]KAH9475381.1 hypothetical protein JR316_0012492 [Psilocybe cubensis]